MAEPEPEPMEEEEAAPKKAKEAKTAAAHKLAEQLRGFVQADAALGDAPVALLDARYLISLAKAGGRLRSRQNTPRDAFLDLATLRKMTEGYGGSLRVVCLSYAWLQPDHPDPQGTTLRLLARVLEVMVEEEYGSVKGSYGVFIVRRRTKPARPAPRAPRRPRPTPGWVRSEAQRGAPPRERTPRTGRAVGRAGRWGTGARTT